MLIFRPHHCRARQGDTVVLAPYILYTLCTTERMLDATNPQQTPGRSTITVTQTNNHDRSIII